MDKIIRKYNLQLTIDGEVSYDIVNNFINELLKIEIAIKEFKAAVEYNFHNAQIKWDVAPCRYDDYREQAELYDW